MNKKTQNHTKPQKNHYGLWTFVLVVLPIIAFFVLGNLVKSEPYDDFWMLWSIMWVAIYFCFWCPFVVAPVWIEWDLELWTRKHANKGVDKDTNLE